MSNNRKGRFARKSIAVLFAAALTSSLLATPSSAAPSGTLTVAIHATPTSLDPALQSVDPFNNMYINTAYASLIRIDNRTGKLVPDLATSWKYTDKKNQVFELTLRKGAKFSDGSPVTPADVVASLDYARTKGVNGPAWLGAISSVTAKGALGVVIRCSEPNDALPYLMSQRLLFGSVVKASAIADPQVLKRATYGAGPYMLDPAQTVANDTYTYVPNPYYYLPSRIKWSKIVLKVVGSYDAALQAVASGAADLFSGNQPTAQAAALYDLKVATTAYGLTGVGIYDREGTIVPALANAKVRQALMLALDRKAIARAVFAGFSTVSSSLLIPTMDGFTNAATTKFDYDLVKARALMSQAGYASGFSVDMAVPSANNTNLAAQAVVQSWARLNVKVNLVTYTDLGQLTRDTLAKKYPVATFNYGALPTYIQSRSFFTGGSTQFNPFNSQDAQITKFLAAAARANTPKAKNAAYASAWGRAADLGWLSNMYLRDQVTIYNPDRVKGVFITGLNPAVDLGWSVDKP